MSKIVLYFPIFICVLFAPTIRSTILAEIENALTPLVTCEILRETFKMDYEHLLRKSSIPLSFVTLTHFANGKKVNTYTLQNAYAGITSSSNYNRDLPMVIYIHGYFSDSVLLAYTAVVKSALIKVTDANVFMMNPSVGFDNIYYKSSTFVRILGEQLGTLLAELYADGITEYHLIGHSLGAQTAGFAGKKFEELTSMKLNRITGLDPAGRCFFNVATDQRLTKTDADFVAIVHSNINVNGILSSDGHVNFFPNGGRIMAGCLESYCSHIKSTLYFAESVSSDRFLAVQCTDWDTFQSGACSGNPTAVMGYQTATSTPEGNYYLVTGPIYPYALAENGIN